MMPVCASSALISAVTLAARLHRARACRRPAGAEKRIWRSGNGDQAMQPMKKVLPERA
jgi:hypothetical protein